MSSNFWSSKDLEPKRQFRFIISLQPGISGQELRFAAKTADRPSYTIGEQEHRFFNHTFYYPGRMNWNTVGMTLVDAVTPGSTEILYQYLSDIGIQQPRDFGEAVGTTITKESAVNSLGDVKIYELGTSGENETRMIGEWSLINAFITEVNFGSHSYDSDEMVELTLTLRYDWAQYTKFAGKGKKLR
tara:strand:+ start:1228 stop:1788 length:561 start_codon:yes stop_codon:yes gene_type:complete